MGCVGGDKCAQLLVGLGVRSQGFGCGFDELLALENNEHAAVCEPLSTPPLCTCLFPNSFCMCQLPGLNNNPACVRVVCTPLHAPCKKTQHRFLDGIGYSISTYGFGGPFIDPQDIKSSTVLISAVNLYCVRKDLRQAQLAHRAGVSAPKKQTATQQQTGTPG